MGQFTNDKDTFSATFCQDSNKRVNGSGGVDLSVGAWSFWRKERKCFTEFHSSLTLDYPGETICMCIYCEGVFLRAFFFFFGLCPVFNKFTYLQSSTNRLFQSFHFVALLSWQKEIMNCTGHYLVVMFVIHTSDALNCSE